MLLDTSAWSLAQREHAPVIQAMQTASRLYLTPIILGELLSGFDRGSRAQVNRRLLAHFLERPRVEVLTVTAATAECYSQILTYLRNSGTPIPTNDIWIAASALEHSLELLSADQHFQRVPQVRLHLVTGKTAP